MGDCTRGLEKIYEPIILLILSRRSSYGYMIGKDLQKKFDCSINIGNLYTCLARFTKKGYVIKFKEKSDIGPDRIFYRITPKGRRYLARWKKELERHHQLLRNVLNEVKNLEF